MPAMFLSSMIVELTAAVYTTGCLANGIESRITYVIIIIK